MTWLYNNPLINAIAWVMGNIMEFIYFCFAQIGIINIGLCIIIFTIVIRMCLLPMQIKQQKFTKLNAVMSPEIKAIQDKYKGKKDQESQMAQQAEIKEIYAKYGTSPTGSCLQLLIQMPILFALYAVIRNVPEYVKSIKDLFTNFIASMDAKQVAEYFNKDVLGTFFHDGLTGKEIVGAKSQALENCINAMTGSSLTGKIPTLHNKHTVVELLQNVGGQFAAQIERAYNFLGLQIGMAPKDNLAGFTEGKVAIGVIIAGIAIPILSGVFQFLSVQLSTNMNKKVAGGQEMPGGKSMKFMNFIMPIFSIYMCFVLPTGIGIYWCAGSLIMMLQQVFINKWLDKKGMDAIIEQNRKKAAKKSEKKKARKGIYRENVLEAAQNKAKAKESQGMSAAEKEAKVQKAKDNAAKKQGSMAAKVNMVSEYNKKNNKKNNKK